MDTESPQAGTTKILVEQKQLFCKLLLLEIEKYEQSLNQLQKPLIREEKEEKNDYGWNGFESLEEVEQFGRNYYHELLENITTNSYLTENDEFVQKYIDENVTNIGNGSVCKGINEWIKNQNGFVKLCQQCYLADFNITSWINYSFSASYTISIIFINDKKVVNKGHVNIVMNQNKKKISYLVETSEQESYQSIVKNVPTI